MGSSLSVTELFAPFRADPIGSAVFTDFDGTLAPIVDDPASARPLPGAVDVLGRLARRYGCVAVVSGRPVAFLQAHLGGHGLGLAGLYGLELALPDGSVVRQPEAEPWEAVVEQVAAAADGEAPPGVAVEHNGLSLVLHFRTSPDQQAVTERWARAEAAATGLVVHPGRMSYELRPPLEFDKGAVISQLSEGRRMCFLGDDRGDLPAFEAIDRAVAEGFGRGVKVAVRSSEAPDELLERADLVVDGPEGALSVLRVLAEDPGGR